MNRLEQIEQASHQYVTDLNNKRSKDTYDDGSIDWEDVEWAFQAGAEYGYKLAVEKAVEWLDHNRPIGTGDPEWEDSINEFKKAMEQ